MSVSFEQHESFWGDYDSVNPNIVGSAVRVVTRHEDGADPCSGGSVVSVEVDGHVVSGSPITFPVAVAIEKTMSINPRTTSV